MSLHPRQSLLPDGLFSFRMEGISKNNAMQNSCPHPLLRPPAVQDAHLHITGSTHLPILEDKTAGTDTEPRCAAWRKVNQGIRQCGARLPARYRKDGAGVGSLGGTGEHVAFELDTLS